MRVGALQVWPELCITASVPARTTFGTSTSPNTMLADLPPSSRDTRLIDGAAATPTAPPTAVDPVSDTMSTSGWTANALPRADPAPLSMLKTPAGTPAASTASAKTRADSDARRLGLSTMVQPAASAGATLQVTWFIGQFHGASSAHTPTGSRRMRVLPQSCSSGKLRSASAASLRWLAPARA